MLRLKEVRSGAPATVTRAATATLTSRRVSKAANIAEALSVIASSKDKKFNLMCDDQLCQALQECRFDQETLGRPVELETHDVQVGTKGGAIIKNCYVSYGGGDGATTGLTAFVTVIESVVAGHGALLARDGKNVLFLDLGQGKSPTAVSISLQGGVCKVESLDPTDRINSFTLVLPERGTEVELARFMTGDGSVLAAVSA